MPFDVRPVHSTDAQRYDLEQLLRSHALPLGFVQPAKIVFLFADGVSARTGGTKLDVSRPTVAKWHRRIQEHGVQGLTHAYPGRKPWKLTARVRAPMLGASRRPPPNRITHRSCRLLATHLGVSKDVVQRVRREADLRPHRLTRYTASTDPDFETKAAEITGLYPHQPCHAAVVCINQKAAIHAPDRLAVAS